MKFKEFCKQKATIGKIDNISDSTVVPVEYAVAVESLITIMKNKLDVLDNINVPFIEAAFECDYESILDNKLEDGDVPDGIINRLSEGLYGKSTLDLNEDEQEIIKVLSVYICIQN